MPTISVFYGILIRMYFGDHPPPHFHALYAEHKARCSIATGEIIDGELPSRAARLVREWASLHRAELEENLGSLRAARAAQPGGAAAVMAPGVKAAIPLEPYVVRVVFADGEVRDVDIEPLLNGPVFGP